MYHGCIVLSVQKDEASPLQVVDSVGFYGFTPCSDTNPLTKWVKKKSGLDIDLTGGCGELRHEDIHYLDTGHGLTGTTLHFSQLRFRNLRENLKSEMAEQGCFAANAFGKLAVMR